MISLRNANVNDIAIVVGFDRRLNEEEHVNQDREAKISKAVLDHHCSIILARNIPVGYAIFDYRFFDQGWIELLVIEEEYRGKGIGVHTLDLICEKSLTKKVFTSTNRSNLRMQKALSKAGFTFAGELIGLDEGDPELFYFRVK